MKIEMSFALFGGSNLGLEKSWKIIEYILKKYPSAKWKKIVDWKKKEKKYIIEIDDS